MKLKKFRLKRIDIFIKKLEKKNKNPIPSKRWRFKWIVFWQKSIQTDIQKMSWVFERDEDRLEKRLKINIIG